jgi:hypothetical protein
MELQLFGRYTQTACTIQVAGPEAPLPLTAGPAIIEFPSQRRSCLLKEKIPSHVHQKSWPLFE